jgi:CRP-like cAMP-binding protein
MAVKLEKNKKYLNFKILSSNLYNEILHYGIAKNIAPGNILFHEGDLAENCYLVNKGCLKLSKLNKRGREVIIRYISPGNITAAPAVLKNELYPVTAHAIKCSEVIMLKKIAIFELTRKYPDILLNILMSVFDRLEDLQTRYLALSSDQVENRIAKLMTNLMKNSGMENNNGVHIDIPLSRQDIADHIGASMYTVSRTLSSWEKMGWIKSSRKQITITNPQALTLYEKT